VVANLEAAMRSRNQFHLTSSVGKIVGMAEKIAGVNLAVTIGD
jgi:hypothetical protein